MTKLTEAQEIALDKFSQAGGHGFGEFSHLSRPTAMALYRRGLIRVGTSGPPSHRHSSGILTESGLAELNASRVARGLTSLTPDRTSIVHQPYAWSEWPVWHDALAKNRIEVRDSSGVRARPRSLAAAHRATRRANMAGTRVSRYERLVVYPYRRVGQRSDSYAVAVGDRPEDVVHRTNSRVAAIKWATRRSDSVSVSQ